MVQREHFLVKVAVAFTKWAEKWVPDAFIFALFATFIVLGFAISQDNSQPLELLGIWGNGFWDLVPFTLQMSLVIITGHVVATAPFVYRLISKLSNSVQSPRWANVMVAFFAMLTSWLNWGFSLIFSAILAKEVAKRVKGLDYRAVAASAFLGLGSIWAQGLSGSAVLQMASPNALQPQIRKIVEGNGIVPQGIISFSNTVFLWQSGVSVLVEIIVVCVLVYFYTPSGASAVTAKDLRIDLDEEKTAVKNSKKHVNPGEWFEHSRILSVAFGVIGLGFIFQYFRAASDPITAINLNIINFVFLTIGILLHGTPARLMNAVKEATPTIWGVILQFPFYAGIAALIINTRLNETLAHFFVSISTQSTFPAIAAIYSMILGVFVPSGGSKWVIEAPYMMQAAHDLKIHLGWVVTAYDLGEALANLVQPFWMLPTLSLLGLKARDIIGYTFLVFIVLVPTVLILLSILSSTLRYPL